MGRVIDSTQRMGHGMGDAEADVGVGHGGHILRKRHALASVGIILDSGAQVLCNQFDGFQVKTVGQRPGALRGIALDGVCQSVHTGGGGQAAGHGGHHIRINDCHVRDIVGVHADEFTFFLHVRDDIVDGGLRAGSAGGRHCDREDGAVLCRSDALERTDVIVLGIVHDNTDALAGIHGGAAADRDHEISAGSAVGIDTLLHILDGRIRLDVRIHFISNAVLFQQIRDLGCHAELHKIRIRCHKSFFEALGRNDPGNLIDRAVPVERHPVQHKTIDCHALTSFDE